MSNCRLIDDPSSFGDDFEVGSGPESSEETPSPESAASKDYLNETGSGSESEMSSSDFDPLERNDNPGDFITRNDLGDYPLLQTKSSKQIKGYYNKLDSDT